MQCVWLGVTDCSSVLCSANDTWRCQEGNIAWAHFRRGCSRRRSVELSGAGTPIQSVKEMEALKVCDCVGRLCFIMEREGGKEREMFKFTSYEFLLSLLKQFILILSVGYFPDIWNQGPITPIFNKCKLY